MCLTLCDPMDCSLPDSSVRGILQTRILEWVVMPSSRRSSQSRDRTLISYVSSIGRRGFFTWEAQNVSLRGAKRSDFRGFKRPCAMIYYISGFQGSALGFSEVLWGPLKGKREGGKGQNQSSRCPALHIDQGPVCLFYMHCAQVSFHLKKKQTNQKILMLKNSFNMIYDLTKLWWTGLVTSPYCQVSTLVSWKMHSLIYS